MNIRHKLILSFLLVALLASVTTLFALRSYETIDTAFDDLIDDPTAMVAGLNELKHSGMRIVSSTNEYIVANDEGGWTSSQAMEEGEQRLRNEGIQAFQDAVKKYENLVQTVAPDEEVTLENIRFAGGNLIETSGELVELKKNDIAGTEVLYKKETFERDESVFNDYIDAALKRESQEQLNAQKNVQSTIALATQRTLAVTALTFLLALFAGFYISYLISRRVGKLQSAIQQVGAGELDTQIDIDSADEVGQLARCFNEMVGDLKTSRSDLANAQNFSEKVLSSMVDFVVVMKMDLTISRINNAALKLNGYEENELIGKSINVLSGDKPFTEHGVELLRQTGSLSNFEKLNLNKDGSLTPIAMSVSLLKDDYGNEVGIVCVGKDVGEQKRVEQVLRDSEARHRLLFESNPLPMYVFDGETYGFLAVNDAAVRQYGYSRDEFLSMTLKDIRPEEDIKLLQEHLSNGLRTNGAAGVWRHRKKDGTLFEAEITAYSLEFGGRDSELVLANDVTEKRRLEAESRIISEIIHGVTTTPNLEELLDLVHRSIGRMINAENFYVALYDTKAELMTVPFCVDKYDDVAPPAKLGRGLTAYVYRTEKAILLDEKGIKRLTDEGEVDAVGTDPAVWLGVPLRTAEGVIGVLVTQHYEDPNAYDQRDVDFLLSVGDQIAIAIERKHADDALRESEERYRELIENAHDIIYTHDLQGNYTSINKAAEYITGYTREESLAMSLEQLVVPESVAKAREMIAKKVAGENTTAYDLDVIAKNGQRVSLEVNTRIVREDGIPVAVQGIARDVTARKRAADELAESQANFKSLFDTANDAILVMDGSTFLDCNHQTEILFGCAKEDIVGHSPIEFSPPVQPDGRPTPEKAGEYMAAAMTGSPQFFEWKHTRLDGTPFDAEVSLNRVDFQGAMHIQAIVRDITARKNAEEEIHWKTALLEAQVGSTIDGILIVDSNGKKILQNQQTTDLLKIPQQIADDKDDAPQVTWVTGMMKDPERFIERVRYLNSHPEEISREEIELTDETILDRYSAPVVGKDGKSYGRIWTFRDVTERKRSEEKLLIFNQKLQQSNRELQDFAYVASHDLQEPLRKVQAFSDRLKTKYGDKLEGEGLDFLERMRNAAQRMQLLIQDLLTFSRVATKASPFISVDLEKVAHEVMSDLEVKIEDTGATVEIGPLPTLDADATQMRQLIQNLVGNALKFQRKDCKPKVEISANEGESNGHGKMCTIMVKDNGIGFDEKYLDKIFAVFQRLHGRTEYEGSGVGLSVCRKIVERHHGSITASSAPGEGATFIINLPLKQRNTEVTDNEN